MRVAVATNFLAVMKTLAPEFALASEFRLELSPGSSGKLYAQIIQGAPYDVLLSADAARPRQLVEEGRALAESRFTYAQGLLALWCSKKFAEQCLRLALDGARDERSLSSWISGLRRVSMADPDIAPYGLAAKQLLTRLSLWEGLQGRLIMGESVGQSYHFVKSENVEAGFVALSQLGGKSEAFVPLPSSLYEPIVQQAVLLKESRGARAFLTFLRSNPKALRLIKEAGYLLPSESTETKP